MRKSHQLNCLSITIAVGYYLFYFSEAVRRTFYTNTFYLAYRGIAAPDKLLLVLFWVFQSRAGSNKPKKKGKKQTKQKTLFRELLCLS